MAKRMYLIDGEKYPSVTTILASLAKPALVQWSANETASYIAEQIEQSFSKRKKNIPRDFLNQVINKAPKAFYQKSRKALDIGSKLHHLIEEFIRFGNAPTFIPESCEPAWKAFLQWVEENDVEFFSHLSEIVVWNTEKQYAGTVDCICKIKGDYTLVDFKSSKDFYTENFYQISAYWKAYQSSHKTENFYQISAYWKAYQSSHKPLSMDRYELKAGILRLDKNSGFPEYRDYSQFLDIGSKAFDHLCDFYHLSKQLPSLFQEQEEIITK